MLPNLVTSQDWLERPLLNTSYNNDQTILYTDGGCSLNDQPDASKREMIAVVSDSNGKVLAETQVSRRLQQYCGIAGRKGSARVGDGTRL